MFFMGKSTISMAIFNSYVSLPEGMHKAPKKWGNRRTVQDFSTKPLKIAGRKPPVSKPPDWGSDLPLHACRKIEAVQIIHWSIIISLFKYCRLEGDTKFSVGKLQKNNRYYMYIIVNVCNIYIYNKYIQ